MDLRYALRSLWKNPGFTILAVLVMGLGIGANTAVFSVVNTVLLKPLDYRNPDRIVIIAPFWKNTGTRNITSSGPDFHDWHDQSTSFSAMAYYVNQETAVTAGSASGSAEYARVCAVTPEFFGVFDIQPVLGRFFNTEEIKPGGQLAALISYDFWQSHFGGKSDALGQNVRVFGRALPIAGVLPPRFQFPDKTDATLLLEPDIPYDVLVAVMDKVRVAEQVDPAANRVLRTDLFPDISIGDAPAVADR